MKVLHILLTSLALAQVPSKICPNKPKQTGLQKRQSCALCLVLCCDLTGKAWNSFQNYRERKRNERYIASQPSNLTWIRSRDNQQYEPDEGPLPMPIPSNTAKPSVQEPKQPIRRPSSSDSSVASHDRPSTPQTGMQNPDSRPPSPSTSVGSIGAVSGASEGGDTEWHPIVGPLFIENGNVAQWILFKKQKAFTKDVMARGKTKVELEAILANHARNSEWSKQNRAKELAKILPKDDSIFTLEGYGGDCAWTDVSQPIESADGTGIHWFRSKVSSDPYKINPVLGPDDFNYFISKSQLFRQKMEGL